MLGVYYIRHVMANITAAQKVRDFVSSLTKLFNQEAAEVNDLRGRKCDELVESIGNVSELIANMKKPIDRIDKMQRQVHDMHIQLNKLEIDFPDQISGAIQDHISAVTVELPAQVRS
ncbi:hypothetical protein QAD02_003596 [Eretmocerus hayati]|uniref:Uncharacterized protein n=1 Tax=Eretmocerus hayati TaxID=131215 RepID=A0ACC2NMN1_9HYME|nr:hypothetical protein QAD02_003596 [Eretmocerus hayati]